MAILHNHPDIGQIGKDLVEACWQANYYKCQCLRGIESRKKMQDSYESEIWKLKAKHKKEAEQLRHEISELSAKVKLRERQLFGKKVKRSSRKKVSKKINRSINVVKSQDAAHQQKGVTRIYRLGSIFANFH